MSATSGSSSSSRGRGWAPSTSRTALTPKSLLKKYTLPIAAFLHTTEVPPGLDTSRPILLYNSFQSCKVRAMSLQLTRDGIVIPVGPALVIPDSYTGWFSVVTPEGRCAPHYTSIEKVAVNKIPFFLSRLEIPAYIKVDDVDEPGRSTYHRTVVQSGHVLKLLGVYEDLNARRGSLNGSRDGSSYLNCTKYAQCLNHQNEVLYVPFTAKGRFYATAHKGSKTKNHVFLMSQLLNTFKLPITVRLICGFMPRVPPAFTGLLRLEKSQKETVIVGCTMTPEARATLLEMDIASNFILTPITDAIFSKTPIFLKTVSYCEDEADSWRRQIKITHHLTEDSSGSSLGRSTSEKTHSTNSSTPRSLPFFQDFETKKLRSRDQSRNRNMIFREFREGRGSSKENKERKSRDQSREVRLRDRVRDRLSDMSRNRQYVATEEFISIKIDEKSSGKKSDGNRKVTKQNTYIFQNQKRQITNDNRRSLYNESTSSYPVSIESQEYSTVVDDLRHISKHTEPQEENIYSEICEHKIVSDSKSGIVRAKITKPDWQDTQNYTSLSSTDDDNHYSFTLLKRDMSRCYVRLPGLQDNGIYRFRRKEPSFY